MRLIRDASHLMPHEQGAVVGIGNFDGVHRGHQRIIEQVTQLARLHNRPSAILTFEPPPTQFFKPDLGSQRIMSVRQKALALHQFGVDVMIAQRFNTAFATLTAKAFIERYLVQTINACAVVTGSEFCFGAKRGGDAAMLAACDVFDYHPVTPLMEKDDSKLSSSQIREAIRHGDMQQAAHLLGRPYRWSARVGHGDKRGRTIGFPTANMVPPRILLPRFGVYVVRCQVQGASEWMEGVANLGVRPTFGAHAPVLEVHVLDRELNLYGKRLEVEFMKHLRDEQRFDGVDALKAQLKRDCQQAREVIKPCA